MKLTRFFIKAPALDLETGSGTLYISWLRGYNPEEGARAWIDIIKVKIGKPISRMVRSSPPVRPAATKLTIFLAKGPCTGSFG